MYDDDDLMAKQSAFFPIFIRCLCLQIFFVCVLTIATTFNSSAFQTAIRSASLLHSCTLLLSIFCHQRQSCHHNFDMNSNKKNWMIWFWWRFSAHFQHSKRKKNYRNIANIRIKFVSNDTTIIITILKYLDCLLPFTSTSTSSTSLCFDICFSLQIYLFVFKLLFSF